MLWLPRKELILYMAKKRANGEGNIRKRKDGRWEGRYTAGYNSETGKHIIKNVLGKTQTECKAKLAAAMEAAKGIDVSRADEYTVATWLRIWYDIYAKPNVRVATADRYRLMIEQYAIPRIGSIKLTKLTAHDLQKLYKELMESGRTNRKSGHGNPGLSSTTVRSQPRPVMSARACRAATTCLPCPSDSRTTASRMTMPRRSRGATPCQYRDKRQVSSSQESGTKKRVPRRIS